MASKKPEPELPGDRQIERVYRSAETGSPTQRECVELHYRDLIRDGEQAAEKARAARAKK